MLEGLFDRPWLGLYSTYLAEVSDRNKETETDNQHLGEEVHDDEDLERSFNILHLPPEVVYKIFSALEPEGLSMAAQVCRAWLVQAYEPSHWRRCAMRMWPREDLGYLSAKLAVYGSWRRLVLKRPHVRTNGIYVMRHLFLKPGTQMPGMPFRPLLNVTYHRFLRFYPDGVIVALTTPERPDVAVRRVRREWVPTYAERDKAHPAVGSYDVNDTVVNVELPMFQRKYPEMLSGRMHYQMALRETREGANNLLFVVHHWGIMADDEGPNGQVVGYDSSQYADRPFRFIPIWGFKKRVIEVFPPLADFGHLSLE